MAGTTGLEPATSAVTGQHSNQLNYVPAMQLDALRNLVAIDDYRFRIQVTFRTGWRRFPPPINRKNRELVTGQIIAKERGAPSFRRASPG
jgi:hypothetical protein